jgi:hypothetical protein
MFAVNNLNGFRRTDEHRNRLFLSPTPEVVIPEIGVRKQTEENGLTVTLLPWRHEANWIRSLVSPSMSPDKLGGAQDKDASTQAQLLISGNLNLRLPRKQEQPVVPAVILGIRLRGGQGQVQVHT